MMNKMIRPQEVPATEEASSWLVDQFHNQRTSWMVLLVSLLLTLTAAWLSHRYARDAAKERFLKKTGEISSAIQSQMKLYEQALWGGVGLQDASNKVDRDEFAAFVRSLGVEENLPGIQGFGYCIPISPGEKDAHEAAIRAEGFDDYHIKPKGVRELYTTIIFLEPFDWRNKRAFGFDMWSNDLRRKAMTRARDTGDAAKSGLITLVQETEENPQRGFLVYLPVYKKNIPLDTVEQRRAGLAGWIYAPFRAGDFMAGILNAQDADFGVELFDGESMGQEALLFDSDNLLHLDNEAHRPRFSTTIPLNLQGQAWTLYVHSIKTEMSQRGANLPLIIGLLGLIVELLLFLVIYSLHKLQVRTRSLASNLADQKLALESANHELTQFAYVASHDLQEPLRTVSNYAMLLEEDYHDKLDQDGKFALNTMSKATERMSHLIKDILSYSQIGKLPSNLQWVDPNLLIEEIRNDLQQLVNDNKASFSVGLLPKIYGDPSLIRQLLLNLITNGIKYSTPERRPVIQIEGRTKRNVTTLSISDNGIGIAPEHQKKIFEIFKRLHQQHEFSGTGIGLAFCKKIADLHGGTIELSSKVGQGSTFVVTFPKPDHQGDS